ncbi:MAG: 30S ribosomal protein S7 [Nanoarchaeota archaeon]|nr:30S ribosomal protein S7 [Nanoarchaeota archaeon]MBU1135251.1 30S ribosomal protein S7 [Nanoarchaeota archaeon]MBU2519899.1 30S ribosomal protein S7 [Nanoarchaeota archaeon]
MTEILLFNRWNLNDVKVEDAGLVKYVNLRPLVVPKSSGKYASSPGHKNKMNIVERFINKMMVAGHRGKKHKITSGHSPASYNAIFLSVKEALEIIEKKSKKNPVQVLVDAIENAAMFEEVASYRLGGMIARKAVVTTPQRRVDLALRYLTQGIYKITFRNKKSLANVIAEELMAAANNDAKSFAISERNRLEKEAEGAR